MSSEWYVKRNDKKLGPFSSKDLRKLATSGKLTFEDLVWKEGLAEWVPASKFESLFSSDSESQTPAPPPATAVVVQQPMEREDPVDFEAEVWPSSTDSNGEEEYPPLPNIGKRGGVNWEREETGSVAVKAGVSRLRYTGDSADRLCWWLKFYATVNFILSVLISVPMMLFGLFLILVSLAGIVDSASSRSDAAPFGGLVFGMSLFWSVIYVVFALLCFMFMNVFTLACSWGVEVLKMLKERS